MARDFPLSNEADWQALVKEALKSAPLSSLGSVSYDGIAIEPLYARAKDGNVIPGREPGEAWAVIQRVDLPDARAANKQILDDLNNAASGIMLVFDGAVGDYGYAFPATEAAIETALKGVHLDWGVPIELDFGPPSRQAAVLIANYVKAKGLAPSAVNIRFGFDPFGAMATRGVAPKPWSELALEVTALIGNLSGQGFTGPFFAGDGRPVHAAGGSEAQELAFALANALAYLRALEAHGTSLEDGRRLIFFRLAADQDQFLTIAKFRAIRKLWARIEEACGLAPSRVFVEGETAWRMMTKRDPHGNIVRGAIAALAAAVGGADAVAVVPFSAALGIPDGFARRIARNTQTILIEEANLHRVADAAAGSGAIEFLTDQLCEKAWDLFQKIDRIGGSFEALKAGLIQKAVAKVRAEREANIASRKDSVIGSSDFPDLTEDKVVVLGAAKAPSVGTAPGEPIEPLQRFRLAEPFERLRDWSDAYLARTGQRPKVFLACLGRASDFTARASFAKSLFEAGGIEAVEGRADNLLKGFKDSGASIACLCSSDKIYASEAASAAEALIHSGAKHVYLAGKPGEHAKAWGDAGIGTFVYQGCDTLGLLQNAYERLGA
ncbi:MAG TPA: methylmalonyl-CoA mutase family protein [Methyloceanibacter sp.]|nr:methylmalonyl-CoA mutase family protein [Methyloceanibacter sp.]